MDLPDDRTKVANNDNKELESHNTSILLSSTRQSESRVCLGSLKTLGKQNYVIYSIESRVGKTCVSSQIGELEDDLEIHPTKGILKPPKTQKDGIKEAKSNEFSSAVDLD